MSQSWAGGRGGSQSLRKLSVGQDLVIIITAHPQVPTLHQALVLKAVLVLPSNSSLQPSELVPVFLFDKAGSWGSAIQQLVQGLTVGPELG